jgi:Fic family protein
MRTFTTLPTLAAAMPVALVRELARVERGRGREELYLEQAPQVLERLAAQSRFESVTASSAIENIVVTAIRARALVDNPAVTLRDRSEREFAGYKDALDSILAREPGRLEPALVQQLHRLLMRHTDDPHAGRLKHANNFVGNRREDGLVEVVFRTVPAGEETERQLAELVARYEAAVDADVVHPLVLVAALVLDFLSIHPFVDGNGRVARLLTTRELLRHGYGVARYVSLEQRIFDAQSSYYETLQESQRGWHEGIHDIWPWTGFLLRLIADAYADLELRVGAQRTAAGSTKEAQAREYILRHGPATFRWADLVAALPDISPASLRNALAALKAEGAVTSGLGRSAVWERRG